MLQILEGLLKGKKVKVVLKELERKLTPFTAAVFVVVFSRQNCIHKI